MAAEDWMPEDWLSDWEYEEHAGPFDHMFSFAPRIPTCYRCGRTGHWVKTAAGSWWLQHQCSAMVSSASEFEDLTNVQNITPTSSSSAGRRPVSRPGNPAEARSRSSPGPAQTRGRW